MARRDNLLLAAERGRFSVTNDANDTFQGVLIDWDDAHVILADVYAVADAGHLLAEPVRLDNEIWIPRNRIKYMQTVR